MRARSLRADVCPWSLVSLSLLCTYIYCMRARERGGRCAYTLGECGGGKGGRERARDRERGRDYRYRYSDWRLAAISVSHLSPLASSFSLLYRSSSRVSVENSKLGPSTMASTGHASWQKPQ